MDGERQGARAQPLSAIVLLLATAAALAGATVIGERAPAPADPAGRAGEPAAIAELAIELTPQVARRVEGLRDLRFDEVPLPRVVTADFLSGLIEDELNRREGDPADALAADEAIARIVGLLGAGESLAGLVEGSGDLAAAAWDPRRERLYVVAGAVGASPAMLELLLAHELTHALEDQAFGLPEPGGAGGDRRLARTALLEGTATVVMSEYAERHIDPLALGAAALGLDPGTEGMPAFAVEQLTWAYFGGARFVSSLRDLGGDWTLVDLALEHRPPASTAQVLDPLRYLRDERPAEVTIDPEPLREAGWSRDETGTVGALATRQLLALEGSRADAARAVAGWRGDRYELWRREVSPAECAHPCREELTLAVRWRWESAADARRFARAARDYIARGVEGERRAPGSWELDGGWVALDARSRTTTLAFAPAGELARSVARVAERRSAE